MNADERDKRYRALLEGPNTGLLVEIARETFRAVMKRIGTLQGIKVHELKVDDIADLAGARDLLVRKKIRIRDQEVTLRGSVMRCGRRCAVEATTGCSARGASTCPGSTSSWWNTGICNSTM